MTKKKLPELSQEERHQLYEAAVQNPETDIDFINKEFKRIYGRKPQLLREDFGGTGYLSCLWADQDESRESVAIDFDTCPQEYGQRRHLSKLSPEAQSRVKYITGDVLEDYDFKSDVTVAFNFSYFIFKERETLLNYFKKVKSGLKDDGAFFLDIFGGTDCFEELEEETEHENFSYYWDCDRYNPLTHEALYAIHFKKGGVKYRNAFTYDWRMWGVREITDLLKEAGFNKVHTFWEGDGDDGTGDGDFYRTEVAENCESWVTYIVGLP